MQTRDRETTMTEIKASVRTLREFKLSMGGFKGGAF